MNIKEFKNSNVLKSQLALFYYGVDLIHFIDTKNINFLIEYLVAGERGISYWNKQIVRTGEVD